MLITWMVVMNSQVSIHIYQNLLNRMAQMYIVHCISIISQ